jgi:hypothetical protein
LVFLLFLLFFSTAFFHLQVLQASTIALAWRRWTSPPTPPSTHTRPASLSSYSSHPEDRRGMAGRRVVSFYCALFCSFYCVSVCIVFRYACLHCICSAWLCAMMFTLFARRTHMQPDRPGPHHVLCGGREPEAVSEDGRAGTRVPLQPIGGHQSQTHARVRHWVASCRCV